jgi:TRAP-type transport system periplasmic protein
MIHRTLAIAGLCLLLATCREPAHNRAEFTLLLGHLANEQDIWHRSALHFAEKVHTYSNGRIEVRIYPSEQLGREQELIRSIRAGIVHMTITGETLQNWAAAAAFCAVPYLIRDSDHLRKTVNGAPGRQIAQEITSKIGLRPLAYFERGPRNLSSNRPIHRPDDLRGIILRVPNVPIFVGTWSGLGAKPTPMTLSELFTALQQGTVEAQENPLALIYSSGLYEVQRYVNLTEHVIGWVYLVIGEKQYQAFPPELQRAVTQAARDTEHFHQALFREEEVRLRILLEEKGMEFIESDQEAFRSAARQPVLSSLPAELHSLYDEIESLH